MPCIGKSENNGKLEKYTSNFEVSYVHLTDNTLVSLKERVYLKFIQSNQISQEDFRFWGIYEWQNVYDKVLEYFVDSQYARKIGLYWANVNGGFRQDVQRIYGF